MNLESLPNELLLYIFKFLPTVDLLHTFHGFNYRFNSLIFLYFNTYGFDFRSICSNDFDSICRRYLPILIDKVHSLYLSHKNDRFEPFYQLYIHDFTISQFSNLKSLSLSHFKHKQLINEITWSLPNLINLTHLSVEHCSLTEGDCDDLSTAFSFINSIWSLPKLTHCYFNETYAKQGGFGRLLVPTVTSKSIKYLSILGIGNTESNLDLLFQRTPNIEYLSISFFGPFPRKLPTSPILSITTLKLSLNCVGRDFLSDILQWMPNLYKLKVDCDVGFDGHKWEEIISKYFPKLKIFQLRMGCEFKINDIIERNVDQLLDTFQTPFWINKHNWFVRCHWSPTTGKASLYTLPYAFNNFHIKSPLISKSTCSQEKNQWLYDSVRELNYSIESSVCPQQSDIKFFKLEKLRIKFPLNDYFWSMIPTFNNLTSLEIIPSIITEEYRNQLELLLSRASHLLSLGTSTYNYGGSIENLLLETKHALINRLDLHMLSAYDEDQCIKLSHSPLAMQCQELYISVINRSSICYLIKTMHNLRLLNVTCRDDKRKQDSIEDELVDWLKKQLLNIQPMIRIYRWHYTIQLRIH